MTFVLGGSGPFQLALMEALFIRLQLRLDEKTTTLPHLYIEVDSLSIRSPFTVAFNIQNCAPPS